MWRLWSCSGVLDAIWLSNMARILYRPTLGNLLLDKLRWLPALAFYFLFPLGVVHFAVLPALAGGGFVMALVNGGFSRPSCLCHL